jgi:hypothetical protein
MAKKKYFYPPAPPVGSETFSDDLVGLQLVNGGGLTNANFEFTNNVKDKANRGFDTGVFSNPLNLESLNVKDIEETKSLIQKNFKIYPNFDLSQLTSFCTYGSLQKRISASVIGIINKFPGAIFANEFIFGSVTAETATNALYDPVEDITNFDIDTTQFRNPLNIDFTTNAARTLETSPLPLSKYRNLTDNYYDYAIYTGDFTEEYKMVTFIPTTQLKGEFLNITVKGNPFSGQSATTKTIIIKPNRETVENIFNTEFDEVEKFLLNRNTFPQYTAKFKYSETGGDGIVKDFTKNVTWPLIDTWNIDISTDNFKNYLKNLSEISKILDTQKTNLISRFLTTNAFKEFDTSDKKMEKLLQIYGRSFDEVKKFVDSLSHMTSVNYIVGDDIPSQLLTNLAQTLGINSDISPITNEGFLNSVFDTSNKNIYGGKSKDDTPTELNYQYFRNVILNSAYMFKSKGTRQSLEYIMRFIGAPEALVEFNEIIYLADSKIPMDEFEEKYVNISGGTIFKQTPTLDRNNTFSIQGVIYSGFTSEGVININELTRKDYGLDDKGFPISPRITNNNFFQKGAGWFEKSPKHRSIEVIDENNSSFVPTNLSLKTKLQPFTFGQEYMDRFRKFDNMPEMGFTLTKINDNKKSWAVTETGKRISRENFNGVNYNVSDDKLIINSKNIELYANVGQGITYDIWELSVKYGYPIPNSALTAPYPTPGNIDWTTINPKPREKTFFEFAQSFYNNFINVRNRLTIHDGKTGGYPTLQSVFWRYLQSEETVGIPTNKFTYQKLIDYTLGLGDYWQRLLEQVVPATTLWLTGQKIDNSIFHRQKFVWRRQRGCVFIPVECRPCTYNGQPFAYDCIDQTLKCTLPTGSPSSILGNILNKVLTSSGYTQSQCDLNSIISTWYVDCRLDNNILVQESFYIGYGYNDYPNSTQVINAINDKLQNLYNFGLNYFFAGNTLTVSNSTCYDDFTNKTLYLNIGINIQINCS